MPECRKCAYDITQATVSFAALLADLDLFKKGRAPMSPAKVTEHVEKLSERLAKSEVSCTLNLINPRTHLERTKEALEKGLYEQALDQMQYAFQDMVAALAAVTGAKPELEPAFRWVMGEWAPPEEYEWGWRKTLPPGRGRVSIEPGRTMRR